MGEIRLLVFMLILYLLPCACASEEDGAEEFREHICYVFGAEENLRGGYGGKLVCVYREKTETGEEEEELLIYKKGDRYCLVLDRGRECPADEHPPYLSPGDPILPVEGECSFMGSPVEINHIRQFLSEHRPAGQAENGAQDCR